jgi:lactate dehydrogenase-like 2-hydroxyacid dehydrogenase
MKILIASDKRRYDKIMPKNAPPEGAELIFIDDWDDEETILSLGADADILLIDAIGRVKRELIERMPKLRLIHSEGVGYESIDLTAARERGVFVCNNKGCNDTAVAEQAILLMLGLLRNVIAGDRAVREGAQYKAKLNAMSSGGLTELRDCSVGLIGLGDIGKATARALNAFGSAVHYFDISRKPPEVEASLNVTYLPLRELAASSDIVSAHVAVVPETIGLINAEFLALMKPTAFVINAARGEIVDNDALRKALIEGRVAGAGFDTIFPEPTTRDNPLVDLPKEVRDRVIYSPHLGGATTGSLVRAQKHMWKNVARVMKGDRPDCVVNGL